MRLFVTLLLISCDLASSKPLYNNAEVYSSPTRWDAGIVSLSQSKDIDNSFAPLQRRTPGKKRSGKNASSSSKKLQPSRPDSQTLNTQTLTASASVKPDASSSTESLATKVKGEAKDRGRSPQRQARPTSPESSFPDHLLTTLFPSRQRTPSPAYVLSKPSVYGDGNRQEQGGARVAKHRPPSPSGSQSSEESSFSLARLFSPQRSLSPDKPPTEPIRSKSSARSSSLIKSPARSKPQVPGEMPRSKPLLQSPAKSPSPSNKPSSSSGSRSDNTSLNLPPWQQPPTAKLSSSRGSSSPKGSTAPSAGSLSSSALPSSSTGLLPSSSRLKIPARLVTLRAEQQSSSGLSHPDPGSLPANPPAPRGVHIDTPQVGSQFQTWIGSMRSFAAALDFTELNGRPGDPNEIRGVKEARRVAQQSRRRADQSRTLATMVSDTHRATSPITVNAVTRSGEHAESAVKAIKAQTAAQTAATFALKGTSKHETAVKYWKSSARQWMRGQTRDHHRIAFATEHNARVYRQVAMEKSKDDPNRGLAFKDAADTKKIAVNDAQTYYRFRNEYALAKEAFSDARSSSSDEEWPLRDTPRTPP